MSNESWKSEMTNKRHFSFKVHQDPITIEIPEDIQRSLEEKDWKTYTRLCARYNIKPVEYIRYLEEEYNCDFRVVGDLIIDMDVVNNFNFLDGVSLLDINCLLLNGRKNYTFNLSNLERVYLPNLASMLIKNPCGQISNLETLNLDSLRVLTLNISIENIRRLNLKNLFRLNITQNFPSEITLDFLNNSDMESLSQLFFEGSLFIDDLRLDLVDWGRYVKLQTLKLNRIYGALINSDPNIVIDNKLEILNKLTYLHLLAGNLSVKGNVNLPNLNIASLKLKNIEDLQGLTLPNLKRLFISIESLTGDDWPEMEYQIRKIIDNKEVIIEGQPIWYVTR